jgi:hypothetical protein
VAEVPEGILNRVDLLLLLVHRERLAGLDPDASSWAKAEVRGWAS